MAISRPLNHYQAATSAAKLRGQYYTPRVLVDRILDRLPLDGSWVVIDPACGDGEFLAGAVAAVARRFPAGDPAALAGTWADRIIGFDLDPVAVAAARGNLRAAFRRHLGTELPLEALRVFATDVLASPGLDELAAIAGLAPPGPAQRVCVVGNPPYVEAKRLPPALKETLGQRYPESLVGAPDLYLYFLHVCLGWLRAGDGLAFVVPNKVLVNANAQRLRERLLAEGRLRGLWFATQARLFGRAAVYPVVLFAGGPTGGTGQADCVRRPDHASDSPDASRRAESPSLPAHVGRAAPAVPRPGRDGDSALRQAGSTPRSATPAPGERPVELVSFTRDNEGELVERERSAVAAAIYTRTTARALFPVPEESALRTALQRLLAAGPGGRLADRLDLRWSISFHRAGLRERYVVPQQPDDRCARPFLGGGPFTGNGEVRRYRLEWAGWWIRYDAAALRGEGNALPDPTIFAPPKVVICQNGRTLRAAYDEHGYALKDTFLCGIPRPGDHPLVRHPRALVGLLCSRAVHFFYSHVFYGGHVGGGYLHFLRSFLVDVPLGRWTEGAAGEAAELVREREGLSNAGEQLAAEERIEALVNVALKLTAAEQLAIQAWAEGDPNWRARERIREPIPTPRRARSA